MDVGVKPHSSYVEPIPLIDYVRFEDASKEVRETLEDAVYADSEDRHLFYEMLSNSPAVVGICAEYFKQLMTEGPVPASEKELAYFAVGLATDTRFVATTHGRCLVDEHRFCRLNLFQD